MSGDFKVLGTKGGFQHSHSAGCLRYYVGAVTVQEVLASAIPNVGINA